MPVLDAIKATRLAAKGLLPRSGGWLDQSATFIDAMQLIQADEARLTADKRSTFGDDE